MLHFCYTSVTSQENLTINKEAESMFKELDTMSKKLDIHEDFLGIYKEFIETISSINEQSTDFDRKRAYRLEKKVDTLWNNFKEEDQNLLMEELCRLGHFNSSLIVDIKKVKGKIVSLTV